MGAVKQVLLSAFVMIIGFVITVLLISLWWFKKDLSISILILPLIGAFILMVFGNEGKSF